MNGRNAKAWRRTVYGDMSLRSPRRYVRDGAGVVRLHPEDLRAIYQRRKHQKRRRPVARGNTYEPPYLSPEQELAERKAWRDAQTIFGTPKEQRGGVLSGLRISPVARLLRRFITRRTA